MATNEAVISFDLNSEPVHAAAIHAAMACGCAIASDWTFLLQDLDKPKPPGLTRTASVLVTPVMGSSGTLVGFSAVPFNWDDTLSQALPRFSSGVYAVVSLLLSDTPFTMLLEADGVTMLGAGNVPGSSAELDSFKRAIQIDWCGSRWTVLVYPTKQLLQSFRSNQPQTQCAILVATVVACLLLFLSYVYLVRSRSKLLMRLVRATTHIVADVFPLTVRASMVRAALRRQDVEDGEPLTPGGGLRADGGLRVLHAIQSLVGLEQTQTRSLAERTSRLSRGGAGVADTFSECTLLLCDVVGFTAWSATVPPEQVFRLLGAIWGALDELAQRLGVFRGCTAAAWRRACWAASARSSRSSEVRSPLARRGASKCRSRLRLYLPAPFA
jgi:hypothetical protein